MKKKVLALLMVCLLAFSLMSVSVSANERVVLDNSAFYIYVPENYMYYTDYSDNFYIMDSDFGSQELEFFIQGNLMFPDGISDATDEEIISKVRRITQWSVSTDVENVTRKRVNGQRAVVIECIDESLGDEINDYYLFTTKEIVSVIKVSYYTDEEKQEIDAMLETFVLNGTNFEGDKPLKPHDFSKSPDYYEAVSGVAEAYYEYDEVFDEVMWFVMGVFGIITLICPAAVIALIVIILKWRREKKLVKEYQGYFGPIEQARINANAQRMYYNGYNPYPQQPAPYGAYPQAQPVYYQPAPQQGDFHTNQTTVINGENQNQM